MEITEVNSNNVVVKDDNGARYRHYFNTCPLWPSNKEYAVVGAKVWGVVGDHTTDGGLLRFFVRKFVALPKSQQTEVPFDATNDVPRSPYDVITAKGMDTTPLDPLEQTGQQLDATLDAIKSRPSTRHRGRPMATNRKASLSLRTDMDHAHFLRDKCDAEGITARAAMERCIRMAMAAEGWSAS